MSNETPANSERAEILTDVIGIDIPKFGNTIKDLTLMPGVAIDQYTQGVRGKYLSPIFYFILVFSLSFMIDSVTGIGDYAKEFYSEGKSLGKAFAQGAEDGSAHDLNISQVTIEKIDEQTRALMDKKEIQMLLLLPGLLLSQWLVFRGKRKSFLHNSYFALYTQAHATLILQIFAPIFFISHTLFMYIYFLLGAAFPVAYNIYAGVNFYSPDWRTLVTRNILQFLLVIPLVFVTAIVFSVIAVSAIAGYHILRQ
jgi:hypothetical protein